MSPRLHERVHHHVRGAHVGETQRVTALVHHHALQIELRGPAAGGAEAARVGSLDARVALRGPVAAGDPGDRAGHRAGADAAEPVDVPDVHHARAVPPEAAGARAGESEACPARGRAGPRSATGWHSRRPAPCGSRGWWRPCEARAGPRRPTGASAPGSASSGTPRPPGRRTRSARRARAAARRGRRRERAGRPGSGVRPGRSSARRGRRPPRRGRPPRRLPSGGAPGKSPGLGDRLRAGGTGAAPGTVAGAVVTGAGGRRRRRTLVARHQHHAHDDDGGSDHEAGREGGGAHAPNVVSPSGCSPG